MNSLGVYFGPHLISIVETANRGVKNKILLARPSVLQVDLEDGKVPEEDKIAAMLKDELEKNKIEAGEVTIGLSGKDLIIRTFDMPILPRQELASAVNFEVKKYIPFKIEELFSDFQFKLDKQRRKNYALFVGIKKEILNKYFSIFDQIDLEVKSVEYSGFSLLRLLALANIRDREIAAVINVDLAEGDEVNFMVLEDQFPLFSRDIMLSGEPRKAPDSAGIEPDLALEKLKNEIRVSLTYYDRTFPLKNINKIFVIMDVGYRPDLENFLKEIGLAVQFIDVNKCTGRPFPFSLAFLKGYSSSVANVKTRVKIDLFSAKEKALKLLTSQPVKEVTPIMRFKSNMITGGVCLFICVGVFVSGLNRASSLDRKIKAIAAMRPALSSVSPEKNYEELVSIASASKIKIKITDDLIKKQLYFTEILDIIPRLLPKGVRLLELSFSKREELRIELSIHGIAYLGDSDKELAVVNALLSRLKENPVLSKYFTDINISFINRSTFQEAIATDFTVSCRNYR